MHGGEGFSTDSIHCLPLVLKLVERKGSHQIQQHWASYRKIKKRECFEMKKTDIFRCSFRVRILILVRLTMIRRWCHLQAPGLYHSDMQDTGPLPLGAALLFNGTQQRGSEHRRWILPLIKSQQSPWLQQREQSGQCRALCVCAGGVRLQDLSAEGLHGRSRVLF